MSRYQLESGGVAGYKLDNAMKEVKATLGSKIRPISNYHFDVLDKSDDRIVEAILDKHGISYRK